MGPYISHARSPRARIASSRMPLAASPGPIRSCSLIFSKNARCASVSRYEITSRIRSCLMGFFDIFSSMLDILFPNIRVE